MHIESVEIKHKLCTDLRTITTAASEEYCHNMYVLEVRKTWQKSILLRNYGTVCNADSRDAAAARPIQQFTTMVMLGYDWWLCMVINI